MKYIISKNYLKQEEQLKDFILHFDTKGTPFGDQDRNSLKLYQIEGKTYNIKSFKIPNIVNQIAYRFFRKSKAQRSFEYAHKLLKLGINTPNPIAYFEFKTFFLFKKSYYISEHLDCDITYRELTQDLQYPNHETILRAFTQFTYQLHEKEVLFLDHSPGNTLIKKTEKGFDFYLVDLNRMKFAPLNFETRIKNFAKLTIHKSMVETMSHEYTKLINRNYKEVFQLMWLNTQQFQKAYLGKKKLKKKLKFWNK